MCNDIVAKEFFENQEKVLKHVYPNIMSSVQAAKRLEEKGYLPMNEYLGEEKDSLPVTAAFIWSEKD